MRRRRPAGHELSAEEDREANRLVVIRRLAAETRDPETYRTVHGRLVRLFVGSYTRWPRVAEVLGVAAQQYLDCRGYLGPSGHRGRGTPT